MQLKLIITFILFVSLLINGISQNRIGFSRVDTIKVFKQGNELYNPWAGGINSAQFSKIDLNFDGLDDLFVFDRSGNKGQAFLNNGTSGVIDYKHAPEYEADFPPMKNWAILIDYNCDGKNDIITSASAGMAVYKNTGNITDGLSFELVTPLLYSYQPPNFVNLFVSSVDIPAISDIDGDGDVDILTFDIFGTYVEYHKNLSMEMYGNCDSLKFELMNKCWGHFSEANSSELLSLYDTCNFNVSIPELPLLDQWEIDNIKHIVYEGETKHSGSSLCTFDEDGNGSFDLLVGDIASKHLNLLNNSGSTPNNNTSIAGQDNFFPSNSVRTEIDIFPAAFYIDVDNDGNRDLVCAPNTENQSVNTHSAWLYLNTNTDNNPTFEYQTDEFLQNDMLDVGEGAMPILFDHNDDGLLDLLLTNYGIYTAGAYQSNVVLYENTGSSSNPVFTWVTDDYMNLSQSGIGVALYPAFADMDNDGDEDMIIGNWDGSLHYYQNIAGPGNPANFVLLQPNLTDVNSTTIDVGQFSTPILVDIDNDNDFDIICGERNGNLNFIENIGNINSFSWRVTSETFGNVSVNEYWDVVGHSIPSLIDRGNGKELIIGSKSGYLHHYGNIDGNLSGSFTRIDTLISHIYEGKRSAPAISDINNDGTFDMILGNYRGGFNVYTENNNIISSLPKIESSVNFIIYPNPSIGVIRIESSREINNCSIELFDLSGRVVFERNSIMFNKNIPIIISGISKGTYICRIKNVTQDLSIHEKVIVQ